MIYAYTGRRSPSLPADPEALRHLEERLRRLLAQSEPEAVVGSAACGADLLVLQAALALHAQRGHPRVEVVLPTPPAAFREESVEAPWRADFDAVLARVREPAVGAVHELGMAPGAAAYERANHEILRHAERLAAAAGGRFLALAVAELGQGAAVDQMVAAAAVRGARELRVDPRGTAGRPTCFVVMPYGRKRDPATGAEIDCDRTYGRLLVPALEHAQLDYRRADETVDAGTVLQPMIADLAGADLVIADLATGNFNVGWELGLRHLFRAERTLLIKPAGGAKTPFDVQSLRSVRYDGDALNDEAVLDAWGRLEPYLAVGENGRWTSASRTDSPVAATMRLTYARVEPPDDGAPDPDEAREAELGSGLARARELADPDAVVALIAGARALPRERRLRLLERAGTLLVRLGEFRAARAPLDEVVLADPEVATPSAHLFSAQSLYRPRDATEEELGKAAAILDAVVARGRAPEAHALLGAIAKRRALLVPEPGRRAQLERAFEEYAAELRRDLNAFYPAVNLVSLGVALDRAYGDVGRRERAERVIPLATVAAETALENDSGDFWATVSLAELALMRALLTPSPEAEAEAEAAYARAAALRPMAGDRGSAQEQLGRLIDLGLPPGPIGRARAALAGPA